MNESESERDMPGDQIKYVFKQETMEELTRIGLERELAEKQKLEQSHTEPQNASSSTSTNETPQNSSRKWSFKEMKGTKKSSIPNTNVLRKQ